VVFALTELGSKLKEAREARGLTLDDIQDLTKIQKRYLKGIEEGNYSMMPGKFYVRAFIKQYAEAVGLEPEVLFETYKQDVPSVYDEKLPEQLSRVQTKNTIPGGNSKVLDFLPKIILGVFAVGLIAVVYYFVQQNADGKDNNQMAEDPQAVTIEESENLKNDKDTNKNAAEDKDKKSGTKENSAKDKKAEKDKKKSEDADKQDKQNEKPAQELAVVTAQGKETAYDLKNAEKFVLKVATTGETWVNILNGQGKSLFQGMLKAGATDSQTFDLSQDTQAVIVVGRSIDTQIFVNDQPLQFAIAPADQVRQDITIRYVKTNE
jgi:cytoskeletal protein RodZ